MCILNTLMRWYQICHMLENSTFMKSSVFGNFAGKACICREQNDLKSIPFKSKLYLRREQWIAQMFFVSECFMFVLFTNEPMYHSTFPFLIGHSIVYLRNHQLRKHRNRIWTISRIQNFDTIPRCYPNGAFAFDCGIICCRNTAKLMQITAKLMQINTEDAWGWFCTVDAARFECKLLRLVYSNWICLRDI